jgi:hypothetical protein
LASSGCHLDEYRLAGEYGRNMEEMRKFAKSLNDNANSLVMQCKIEK